MNRSEEGNAKPPMSLLSFIAGAVAITLGLASIGAFVGLRSTPFLRDTKSTGPSTAAVPDDPSHQTTTAKEEESLTVPPAEDKRNTTPENQEQKPDDTKQTENINATSSTRVPPSGKTDPSATDPPIVENSNNQPKNVLTESDLLKATDKIVKDVAVPTTNEFKKEQKKEIYHTSLAAFKGKKVLLKLTVQRVTRKQVFIDMLTLDPEYGERWMQQTQRFMAGGPPPVVTPDTATAGVFVDFTGSEFRDGIEKAAKGSFPADKLGKDDLEKLEKGDSVLVAGEIVSFAPYQARYLFGGYYYLLISVKPTQFAVKRR